MRTLKIILVTAVLLLGGGMTYAWWHFQPCLGSMSQCYRSWHAKKSNTSPMELRRATAIYGGFTASTEAIAFQAPIAFEADGLVVVDRASKQARLIATPGFTHWSPRFSEDGKRLVFVRMRAEDRQSELMQCVASTWTCTSLLKTAFPINSPIDVGRGKALASLGSPSSWKLDCKERGCLRYDFYVVTAGETPKRLTHLELLSTSSISLGSNQLYFGAPGLPAMTQREGCDSYINCDKSEIFRLEFDPQNEQIVAAPAKLRPAFLVSGMSVRPTISPDGTRIAFINTSLGISPYRYNLKILSNPGHQLKTDPTEGNSVSLDTIPLQGISFSSGAFTGGALLVNELFADRYRIREFNHDLKEVDTIDIEHSTESLLGTPRIQLTVLP